MIEFGTRLVTAHGDETCRFVNDLDTSHVSKFSPAERSAKAIVVSANATIENIDFPRFVSAADGARTVLPRVPTLFAFQEVFKGHPQGVTEEGRPGYAGKRASRTLFA